MLLFVCWIDSFSSFCWKQVGDFGLTAAASARLQQELLTWQWMAPEAFLGENYTETCDLYSFGMILWEIFSGSGEIPFESVAQQEKNKKKQAREFMNDIIHKNLRPTCASSFPEDLTQLVLRLWERDPNLRPSFSTCLEVLLAMQSGAKRPDDFVKKLLTKERVRANTALVAFDRAHSVPQMNVKASPAPFAWSELVVCAAMRPSVDGLKETLWLGGAQGGLLVVEPGGKIIFELKKAHLAPVTSLVCNLLDGKVWSGAGDGTLALWDVEMKSVEVPIDPSAPGSVAPGSSATSVRNSVGASSRASPASAAAINKSDPSPPKSPRATLVSAGSASPPPQRHAAGSAAGLPPVKQTWSAAPPRTADGPKVYLFVSLLSFCL